MSSLSMAVGDMLVRTSEFREQTEKVGNSAGELKTNANPQIAVKVGWYIHLRLYKLLLGTLKNGPLHRCQCFLWLMGKKKGVILCSPLICYCQNKNQSCKRNCWKCCLQSCLKLGLFVFCLFVFSENQCYKWGQSVQRACRFLFNWYYNNVSIRK